jgi:hypothetical protein
MAGSSSHHIRKILCFRWIQSCKRKRVFRISKSSGQVLAERKIHLVYGGGSLGLMRGVSIAVFLGGSQVLGVVPKALAKGDNIGKKKLERNYRSPQCLID